MGDEVAKKMTRAELIREVKALRRRITGLERTNGSDASGSTLELALRERVKELNSRFGDWYFEISDEVYQKIHLNKDQIIKTTEKPDAEDSAEASGGFGDLNKLKQIPSKCLDTMGTS